MTKANSTNLDEYFKRGLDLIEAGHPYREVLSSLKEVVQDLLYKNVVRKDGKNT